MAAAAIGGAGAAASPAGTSHCIDPQVHHHHAKKKKDKKRGDKKEKPDTTDAAIQENEPNSDESKKKRKKGHTEDCVDGDMILGDSAQLEQTNGHTDGSSGKEKKKKKKNKTLEAAEEDGVKMGGAVNGKESGAIGQKKKGNNEASGDCGAHLEVKVSGIGSEDSKFRPIQSFSDVNVPKEILECCKDFKKPSPIQSYAWPFLLDGRNLIGIAATGSGKTLAFGLPALVHVLQTKKKKRKPNCPTCLVLSPTRELAQQITEVLVEAGNSCEVRTTCLYGGTSKKPQISALKSGTEIVVATPGRLQDLVDEGHCSLQEVSYVVLDEADRMLDLGFEHIVRALIGQTLKSRQMIMFSATWPSEVDQLSKEFMGPSPIKVIVGSQDLAANHAVTQVVEVIDMNSRDARLIELLREYHKSERNRILVFVLYKKEAARVESMLQRKGWNVCAVHGDKGQVDRNKAVTGFKDGTCPLLIATDVAARGLDIPDVEYVINYSFPLTTEDYVHRIGRTGRAGKTGIAHTFFTQADKARAGELVNVLKEAGQRVPPEILKFGTSVKKKESKLYGAHFKEVAADAPKATKITFDSDED